MNTCPIHTLSDADFELIFRLHYRPLCLYAVRLLDGRNEVAEDIVMDCLLKLWERTSRQGEGVKDVKFYLYASTHNACIDWLRQMHETVLLEDVPEEFTELQCQEASALAERHARLWTAIDTLPKRCREILLLSKRDGLTNAAIAQRLGISLKTVESQLTKAYKALRGRKADIYDFLWTVLA